MSTVRVDVVDSVFERSWRGVGSLIRALTPERDVDTEEVGNAVWERRLQSYVRHETDARADHLLFVGTPHGYALLERAGDAPKPLDLISAGDDYDGSFRVTKVGPSPLPNDSRLCAYLEPAAPRA